MSDFMNWSRWFERAILFHEGEATETVFAVMGWIIAHADNVGTGFAFDDNIASIIAGEVGSTRDKVEAAIQFLLDEDFIAEKERHETGVIAMRALFT